MLVVQEGFYRFVYNGLKVELLKLAQTKENAKQPVLDSCLQFFHLKLYIRMLVVFDPVRRHTLIFRTANESEEE